MAGGRIKTNVSALQSSSEFLAVAWTWLDHACFNFNFRLSYSDGEIKEMTSPLTEVCYLLTDHGTLMRVTEASSQTHRAVRDEEELHLCKANLTHSWMWAVFVSNSARKQISIVTVGHGVLAGIIYERFSQNKLQHKQNQINLYSHTFYLIHMFKYTEKHWNGFVLLLLVYHRTFI